jgi:hypothetical protein
MATFLLIIATFAACIGSLALTQATAGVGGICVGCFLAICARIAQASAHHKQLMASNTAVVPPVQKTAAQPSQMSKADIDALARQ